MSQVLGVPNLYYLDKKAAGLLAAKYANRRRVYSHSNGTNDKVSYTFKHRQRTCDGYFPNSLQKISYLRYVWDICVRFFVGKTSKSIFPWTPWPNVSTTPLQRCGFRQCLPFSWTTLRDKHCRQPIAVMEVVKSVTVKKIPDTVVKHCCV